MRSLPWQSPTTPESVRLRSFWALTKYLPNPAVAKFLSKAVKDKSPAIRQAFKMFQVQSATAAKKGQ